MRSIRTKLGAALAIALITSGCGSSSNLTGIQVYPLNPNATVGTPVQFSVTAFYSNNTQQTVPVMQTIWSSSDLSVATIDAKGVATSLSAGSTTITASANGRKSDTVLSVVP